jgi:hypothetical protein
MSAWGAPSPRSRPAGVEVSLDKADAVIEGPRLSASNSRLLIGWQTHAVNGQPAPALPLPATANNILTLVTCYPFYFVGPAPKRFIVRAHRIPG